MPIIDEIRERFKNSKKHGSKEGGKGKVIHQGRLDDKTKGQMMSKMMKKGK